MANKELSIKQLLLRNDTSTNWTANNPVLGKGEMGIEIDSNKFKLGDGVKGWNELAYATSNEAETAKKLLNARSINITGDASGSASFDGSANANINLVLANSGATAGTYSFITVNAKGLITSIRAITAADVPMLTLSKISDAGTAASKNVGTASGNVVAVGSDGKIPTAVIPSLAISDIHEVSSQSAMLALSAQTGDVAVRTDENKTYMLKASPASTLANWVLLRTPTDAVLSVNGQTGAITLTTGNISEGGSNFYFTAARFNSYFAAKSVSELSNGSNVVLTDDTLTLNCGNA